MGREIRVLDDRGEGASPDRVRPMAAALEGMGVGRGQPPPEGSRAPGIGRLVTRDALALSSSHVVGSGDPALCQPLKEGCDVRAPAVDELVVGLVVVGQQAAVAARDAGGVGAGAPGAVLVPDVVHGLQRELGDPA